MYIVFVLIYLNCFCHLYLLCMLLSLRFYAEIVFNEHANISIKALNANGKYIYMHTFAYLCQTIIETC